MSLSARLASVSPSRPGHASWFDKLKPAQRQEFEKLCDDYKAGRCALSFQQIGAIVKAEFGLKVRPEAVIRVLKAKIE